MRLIDRKALSLLRPSPRLFRPWSVIWSSLFAIQQTHLTKVTYPVKSRLMDCKALSLLRPSLRLFRPVSVIWGQLFTGQHIYVPKVTHRRKLRLMDSKELSLLRLSPKLFRPSSSKAPLIFLLETDYFLFYPFPHLTFAFRLILPSDFPQPSLFLKIHLSTIEIRDMSIVLMIQILPFTEHVHSTNLLHWFHHVCEHFYSSLRPIWIKYEIITPLYRKFSSNFKISASVLFANCELRLLLLTFISYLQVYWHL